MEATVPFKAAYILLAKNEETFDKDYSDEAKNIIDNLSALPGVDSRKLYEELNKIDFLQNILKYLIWGDKLWMRMCKGIVELVITTIRTKSKAEEAVDEKQIDDLIRRVSLVLSYELSDEEFELLEKNYIIDKLLLWSQV